MQVFTKDTNIFKILSEAISEGIIVMNESQSIVATNEAANQIFGYTSDEITGLPLDVLIPKKFHKSHKEHVRKFLKESDRRQMGQEINLFGLRKCGSKFPLEVGLNPFSVYGNKYVMALVVDITARKKAESEQQQWTRIFNELLNEIYIFDAHSLRFIDVNRGALNNTGYSLPELKELTLLDLNPEIDRTQFEDILRPIKTRNKQKITFKSYHRRKDGSEYPVEVHLQSSNKGDTDTMVAIILDITERLNYTKNLEKEVVERTHQIQESLYREQELNELKTKFLSLVSHEFKTPLSGILTSSILIGKYQESNQQEIRDRHLATIQNKVRHLNGILNDFLSIERLESGKMKYQITHFPFDKIINEVLYEANMSLKEGQSIEYPDHVDNIYLDFDEKILSLILSNLVGNAIKYSYENTKIIVMVRPIKELLEITIQDSGFGIPEDEQQHIFKRYFRASNALKSQGTGIGLNMLKSHLENLEGHIFFSSEENKGSSFVITIPLADSIE